MASSTQFSIRSLMITTVLVAVVSAVLGPRIRQLEPEHQVQLAFFVVHVTFVVVAYVLVRFFQRHRVERSAGPLLCRTDAGERDTRWYILLPAVALATAAMVGMMRTLGAGESVHSFGGIVLGFCVMGASLLAADFSLHWWWQTGSLITEFHQNGLVIRGVVLRPWSVLDSYFPARDEPSTFVVTEPTRKGTRVHRIHVATHDRADLERIFSQNGVVPGESAKKAR